VKKRGEAAVAGDGFPVGIGRQKGLLLGFRQGPGAIEVLHGGGQKGGEVFAGIADRRALPVDQDRAARGREDIGRHQIAVHHACLAHRRSIAARVERQQGRRSRR